MSVKSKRMCAESVMTKEGCVLVGRKSGITQLCGPLQGLTSHKDSMGQLDKAAKPDPLTQATRLLPEKQQKRGLRGGNRLRERWGPLRACLLVSFSENSGTGVENRKEPEGRPRPRCVTHFTLQSPFNS